MSSTITYFDKNKNKAYKIQTERTDKKDKKKTKDKKDKNKTKDKKESKDKNKTIRINKNKNKNKKYTGSAYVESPAFTGGYSKEKKNIYDLCSEVKSYMQKKCDRYGIDPAELYEELHYQLPAEWIQGLRFIIRNSERQQLKRDYDISQSGSSMSSYAG